MSPPENEVIPSNRRMRGPSIQSAGGEAALALFGRVGVATLGGAGAEGRPLLRTLHVVPFEGGLVFHAGRVGEKLSLIGRPITLGVHEVVAEIPSHFIHPELACPATTYFRSALAEGVFTEVLSPSRKASALEALMSRYQPEGGHAPIDPADDRYRARIDGVLVAELRPTALVAKHKLGQKRSGPELRRILEKLHERGAAGDLEAIAAIVQENADLELPSFLRAPGGLRIDHCPSSADARRVSKLLEGTYWHEDTDEGSRARSHRGSTAWVVIRDGSKIVASGRALSDGARHAEIYDVIVHAAHRGRGLGSAVMRALLDHPAVRGAALTHLRTRDAEAFYTPLGFERRESPYPSLVRSRLPDSGSPSDDG